MRSNQLVFTIANLVDMLRKYDGASILEN